MTDLSKIKLIIEILNPFSNSIKQFNFESNIHFDKLKAKIARGLSLELASFHFIYSTDDGDDIKLDNNFELKEAISYFSDDEDEISLASSLESTNDLSQLKTIILKLSLVLNNLPSLSEKTTSSASGSEIGKQDYYSLTEKGKKVERNQSNRGGKFETRREEIGSHSFFPQIPPPANTQYPPWVLNSNLSERSYAGPPGFSAPSTSILNPQVLESIPTTTREVFTGSSNSTSSEGDSTPATTPEVTPPALLPNSAPPTYRSESLNDNTSNPKRISIQNDTSTSTSEFSDYTYITTTSTSSTSSFRHVYKNRNQRRIKHLTFSEHIKSSLQESYNVPNFLASLSTSTGIKSSKVSTPSIFSSLPDTMILKCCGCDQRMIELRYICDTYGPVLPSEAEGEFEDQYSASDDRTEVLREEFMVEKLRVVPDFEDPLGVIRASQIALPLSPLSPSTTESSHSFTCPPVLPTATLRAPMNPSGILPVIEEEGEEEEEELERDGYELCSNCVETIGVAHAIEMSKLEERRRSHSSSLVLGEGEEEGTITTELRHAFSECMKLPGNLHGWREVDYDDAPFCTICKEGPIVTNRFKCLSCTNFELCLNCFRTVEDIHPIHTFLTIPDLPARPNNFLIPTPTQQDNPISTIESTRVSPEDFRQAFLRARGVNTSLMQSTELPHTISLHEVRHVGIVCFGCLTEIVGPRFTCSSCMNFNLCSKCELIDPLLTDGRHEVSHIILKIKIPISSLDEIDTAITRARILNSSGTTRLEPQIASSRQSVPIISPPPPPESVYHYPPSPNYINAYSHISRLPPPPHHSPQAIFGEQSLPGTYPLPILPPVDKCDSCDEVLLGIKWLCANCEIRTFLCSKCENSCHITHDNLHCFLRITGPLHPSLPNNIQLLPILYDLDSFNRSSSYSNDSTSSDQVGLHSNVLCDFCLDNVNGWSRCVHCETSFDICSNRCLDRANHFEGVHVFVKFSNKVDIQFLKELTGISNGSAPKALIPYAILQS